MTENSGAKNNYHRLKLSAEAFRITVLALSELSNSNYRYETIHSLVAQVCEGNDRIPEKALDALRAFPTISGEIKVFLRVKKENQDAFERFRGLLAEALGPSFRVAEAVILCCLMIAPSQDGLPPDT